MITEDQEKFLFDRLQASKTKYKSDSKRLKIWVFGFRIAVLLLGAISTILLGWNPENMAGYEAWSRNVALAIGALSTFILGISSFWNVETYWLKQKVMFARIRALQEKALYLKAKAQLTGEQIEIIYKDYCVVLDDRIEYWEGLAFSGAPNKNGTGGSS